jgi:plasmid stability protein
MKTTVDLPDDLVKEVKLRAVHEGKKLKEEVANLLRAGLGARPARIKMKSNKPRRIVIKKDRRTGLPVIQCPPDAPARRMTTAELLALEHESQTREDLERLGIPFRQ